MKEMVNKDAMNEYALCLGMLADARTHTGGRWFSWSGERERCIFSAETVDGGV